MLATASCPHTTSRLVGQVAAEDALAGIGPRDAAEGMLAAQMVAVHEAAMECLRRAMLDGQSFEGRQANLGQAGEVASDKVVEIGSGLRWPAVMRRGVRSGWTRSV